MTVPGAVGVRAALGGLAMAPIAPSFLRDFGRLVAVPPLLRFWLLFPSQPPSCLPGLATATAAMATAANIARSKTGTGGWCDLWIRCDTRGFRDCRCKRCRACHEGCIVVLVGINNLPWIYS